MATMAMEWEDDGKLTRNARSTSDPRARSAYLDAKAEGGTKEGPGRAVERGNKKKPAPAATEGEGGEPRAEKRTSALPRAVEVPTTQRLSQLQPSSRASATRGAPSLGAPDGNWWGLSTSDLNKVGDASPADATKARTIEKETVQRRWYIHYVVCEAVERCAGSNASQRVSANELPKLLEARAPASRSQAH